MSGGPQACFPCAESSDLAVAGQALVVPASLMDNMNPWKPLEAAQVAGTGGREGGSGFVGVPRGEGKAHMWVGMSQGQTDPC